MKFSAVPRDQVPPNFPYSPPVPNYPVDKDEERVAPSTPADLKKVAAAVKAIPNDGPADYDWYWRVIAAINGATDGSDYGHELALEFSMRHPAHDDSVFEGKIWKYLHSNRGKALKARTLYEEADKHNPKGWYVEDCSDDFDIIEPAANDTHASPPSEPRSALHLLNTEFKPVMFTIENLLPEGVFLLVASPKVGKSWLSLQIGLAVASGGIVLGQCAKQGDALMLTLEDNERRLQSRLRTLRAGDLSEAALARIHFETEWPRIGKGGGERITHWLDEHPSARLVVVDVLERIRPARNAKANAYGEDYEALKELKRIADQRQVTVLVVHHTRKAASDDAMQMISGTQGLAGAADGSLVLERPRGEKRGKLHIMARDLEREGAFAVEFHGGQWSMVGPASAVATTETQQQLLDLLHEHGPMTPKQLGDFCGKDRAAVQRVLARMFRDGLVIHAGAGTYSPNDLLTNLSVDLSPESLL